MELEQNTIALRPIDSEYLTSLIDDLSTDGRRRLLDENELDKVTGNTTEPQFKIGEKEVNEFEGCHLQGFIKKHTPKKPIDPEYEFRREKFLGLFRANRSALLTHLANIKDNEISKETILGVFDKLAEHFKTSDFQVLLSFFEYCHAGYFPLRIFDQERKMLKTAIDDMMAYKVFFLEHQKQSKLDAEILLLWQEKQQTSNQSDILAQLIQKPRYLDTPLAGISKNGGGHAKKPDELSLSPLNHSDIPFQGRKEEIAKLDEFMADAAPFQMLYMIAPSGAGKTRLITEWHRNNPKIKHWQSGFVEKDKGLDTWEEWKSEPLECDTLIIVDYIYRFKQAIQLVTDKGALHAQQHVDKETGGYRSGTPKLRLIMLDHVMPQNGRYDDMDSHKRQATGHYTESYSHHHSPLFLGKTNPQDHEKMIKGIIGQVSGHAADSERVNIAYDILQRMDSQGRKDNDGESVRFANYPLFAILMGKKLTTLSDHESVQTLTQWQRRDLIAFYFDGQSQWRIPWKNNKEFGAWVGAAISSATALQTLPYQVVFDVLNHPDTRASLNNTLSDDEKLLYGLPKSLEQKNSLISTCNHIVSSMEEDTLLRYQPDILGETFTLRFVADYEDDFVHHTGVAIPVFKMLCSQQQQKEGRFFIHRGLLEFAIRTARNLNYDDPTSSFVKQSWKALSRLLDPENYHTREMKFVACIACIEVSYSIYKKGNKKAKEYSSYFLKEVAMANIAGTYLAFHHNGNVKNEEIFTISLCLYALVMYAEVSLAYFGFLNPGMEKFFKWCIDNFKKYSKGEGGAIFIPVYHNAPLLLSWILSPPHELDVNETDKNLKTPLIVACLNGLSDIVNILLEAPRIIPHQPGLHGTTAFMCACANGHTDVVNILLDRLDIKINQSNDLEITPLAHACANGHVDTASRLLAIPDIKINQPDSSGYTPLAYACEKGHADVVKILLNRTDIEINQPNNRGLTPLAFACKNGHSDVVNILLDRLDIKVNEPDGRGFTPLAYACGNGHADVVSSFISRPKIQINQEVDHGVTLLMLACQDGHVDVVSSLLSMPEININVSNDMNQTALMYACEFGFPEIVNRLLDIHDIKINPKDDSGSTALHFACEHGHTDIVDSLLGILNIKFNEQDNSGYTPLMYACQNGHLSITNSLLAKQNIKINDMANDGTTALIAACRNGHADIVNRLLLDETSINVNQQGNHGTTALISACRNGYIEIVNRLLTAFDIKANQPDDHGLTPLMYACSHGYIEITNRLLGEPSINVNEQDDTGNTALIRSAYKNHDKITFILLDDERVDPSITNKLGFSVYHFSLTSKNKAIRLRLISNTKFDTNKLFHDGLTPLMLACKEGDTDIIEAALSNPNTSLNSVTGDEKMTALMFACINNQSAAVELLLDSRNSINVNAVNNGGWTALMIACANTNITIVKQILSIDGVDIRVTDKNGISALTLTDGPETEDITNLLLEYNAFSFKKWCKKIFDFFKES